MLKFLVDHNVPQSVSHFLREQGFDVLRVKDIHPELPDEEILKHAQQDDRIVLTNDNDFVGLAPFYQSVDIILFTCEVQRGDVRIAALKRTLPDLKQPFGLLVIG